MAKLTDYKSPAEISEIAKKMAEDRIADLHKNGLGHEYSFSETASQRRKDKANELWNTYTEYLLDNDFPEDEIVNDAISTSDYIKMAESKKPPSAFYDKKLNDKFRADANNILFGKTDALGNVIPMTNEEVAKKATEWGVKWGDVDQRSKFMHKVGEQGKANARAQVVRDFENGKDMGDKYSDWSGKAGSIIASMAYPTATDEAKRQAFTGNYDDGRLTGALILDGVTQAGMAVGGPALGNAHWALAPASQFGIELGRQGVQKATGLGDGTFDFSDAVVAGTAGITSPALKGMLKQTSKIEGAGKEFARGVSATEVFEPVTLEKEALKAQIERAGKRAEGKLKADVVGTGYAKDVRNGVVSKEANTARVFNHDPKNVDDLYNHPEQFDIKGVDYMLLPENAKNYIENIVPHTPTIGVSGVDVPTYKMVFGEVVPVTKLQDKLDEIGKITPMLTQEMTKPRNSWYTAGKVVGSGVGTLGGSLEPTYRPNVQALPSAIMNNGDLMQYTNNANINIDNLEETAMFKALPKEEKIKLRQALKTIREEERKAEETELFTDQNP